MQIRDATQNDLQSITDIYNEAIENTAATFDTTPMTMDEQREWFEHHDADHPILVAEENGAVIGWGSLSAWSDRCAYADTAEISVYVHVDHRGKGIGKRLTRAIIDRGQKIGLHTLVARMSETSQASIHILESLNFRHIGVMKEVGYKFGKRMDVHMMQVVFPEEET